MCRSTTPELCVTDAATIKNSAAEVASRLNGDGLSGLVNVAGIGMSGPLEYVTPEELRRMFEVDVFGQLAVTQAFLPMLYEAETSAKATGQRARRVRASRVSISIRALTQSCDVDARDWGVLQELRSDNPTSRTCAS